MLDEPLKTLKSILKCIEELDIKSNFKIECLKVCFKFVHALCGTYILRKCVPQSWSCTGKWYLTCLMFIRSKCKSNWNTVTDSMSHHRSNSTVTRCTACGSYSVLVTCVLWNLISTHSVLY